MCTLFIQYRVGKLTSKMMICYYTTSFFFCQLLCRVFIQYPEFWGYKQKRMSDVRRVHKKGDDSIKTMIIPKRKKLSLILEATYWQHKLYFKKTYMTYSNVIFNHIR